MKLIRLLAGSAILLVGLESAQATVIGFEDLGNLSRTFTNLGVSHTYQGYDWGYGVAGGVANRQFIDSLAGAWYRVTSSNPDSVSVPPLGVDGTSFAFNFGDPQSLWVDFRASTDVNSINVATGYKPSWATYQYASSIQLFGYDANDNLIGQTDILALSNTFQTLTANFSGVRYLEIRANAARSFSVDDLVVNASPALVPLPGSLSLVGLGLAGMAGWRRRTRAGWGIHPTPNI